MTALSTPCLAPRRALVACVLAGALVGGCGTTDDRPPVWEYISPAILQPNCATVSCHSRATAAAGLDFSSPSRGYTSLTGLRVEVVDPTGVVDTTNGRPLVTPYDPGQSRVVNMLRGRGAARMPPDRPLSDPDIQLIEKWILRGASQTPGQPMTLDASAQDGAPSDAGPPDAARDSATDGGATSADGGGGDAAAADAGDARPADAPAAADGSAGADRPDAGSAAGDGALPGDRPDALDGPGEGAP